MNFKVIIAAILSVSALVTAAPVPNPDLTGDFLYGGSVTGTVPTTPPTKPPGAK